MRKSDCLTPRNHVHRGGLQPTFLGNYSGRGAHVRNWVESRSKILY